MDYIGWIVSDVYSIQKHQVIAIIVYKILWLFIIGFRFQSHTTRNGLYKGGEDK